MKLAWGLKVSLEFCQNVIDGVTNIGWTPDQSSDLMSCMAWESGRTFSASIKNAAGSGATGLIQFMDSTAEGLGTTTENLALLRPEEQLTYVFDYFKPYAHRIHTLSDMYMAILLPKYIDADNTAVLFNNGTVAYRQNSGFDANNDGKVTKIEATSRVQGMYNLGITDAYARNL